MPHSPLESTPRAGQSGSYRPALDGLRAVAVILVMANHASLPGFSPWMGQVGVSIFFVISGYLITGLLVTRREGLVAFWQRRALRLLPALLLLLLVITPIALLRGSPTAWHDSIFGILYIGNWPRSAGDHMGFLGNLWSLAIEEQFYLVWPLVLLFLRPRVRWLLGAAVVVAALRVVLPADGAFYGSYGRADALLLGGAIALSGVRFPRWSTLAGFALVGGVYLLWLDKAGVATWGLTVASIAGVLLVGGLAQHPALGLDRREPRAIGRISYGLYLWNYPMVMLFDPLLGSIATVVAAVASYHAVERPFLRLKDRLAPRRARPEAAERAARPGTPVPVHVRFDS